MPDEGVQSEARSGVPTDPRSGVPTDPPASSASAPAGEPSDAPRDAVPAVGTGSVDLRVASDASGASSGSDASDPPDSAGALGVPDGEGAATVRDSAPDSASSEYEAIPYEENYHGHVYRTRTGECYHFESPCGRGTYFETTWEEVERLGLRACEKCVLH